MLGFVSAFIFVLTWKPADVYKHVKMGPKRIFIFFILIIYGDVFLWRVGLVLTTCMLKKDVMISYRNPISNFPPC